MEVHKSPSSENLLRHNFDVVSVCFSPDGTNICSVGKEVTLWGSKSGTKVSGFSGHTRQILSVDYSSTGKLIATGSSDKSVRLWDPHSETGNASVIEEKYLMISVLFNGKGDRLYSGSSNMEVKIWDVETMKETASCRDNNHEGGYIYCLHYSPSDENSLASAHGGGHCVKIWDLRIPNCTHTIKSHTDYVDAVRFHPGGNIIASCSDDKDIKFFDTRNFKLLHTFTEHLGIVEDIAFHPNGNFLISAGGDHTIVVFDVLKKKVLYKLKDHNDTVNHVQFSPDGKYFASASSDQTVILWNSKMCLDDFSSQDEQERTCYFRENYIMRSEELEESFDGLCFKIVFPSKILMTTKLLL